MAKRTINSPGVEIRERDLSLRVPQAAGTNVYVAGYADQGPIDEVVDISSLTEFELIYGTPKSPAERYFYHTVKSALNSTARLKVNRIPYGTGSGEGFGSRYSVLAYPAVAVGALSSQTTVDGFDIELNFGDSGSGFSNQLSGAEFSFILPNLAQKTVNFSINGAAPLYGANALLSSSSSSTYTVPVSTSTTSVVDLATIISNSLSLSTLGYDVTVTSNDNIVSLAFNTGTVSTFTGSVTGSAVPGFSDPVVFLNTTNSRLTPAGTSGVTNKLNINEGTYFLGQPTQFNINEEEYLEYIGGTTFSEWSPNASTSFTSLEATASAALVIINKGQTVIDGKFNGYYVGISDNTNINPASNYDAILDVKTVTQSAASTGLTNYVKVPASRFAFALTATPAFGSNPAINSISQVMEEKITGFDTSTRGFDDALNVGVFKLRQSVFGTDVNQLDYLLEEGYNGSIGYSRQINSENGGQAISFFLENVENTSRNVDILVNPYVSDQFTGIQLNSDGTPKKKVRVITTQLGNYLSANTNTAPYIVGCTYSEYQTITAQATKADSLYPLGAYGEAKLTQKDIGNLPAKVTRALDRIRNDEVFDIDVIAEGGLGTIWTTVCATNSNYFDDTKSSSVIDALRTSNELTGDATKARDYYTTIASQFVTFCGPLKDGGRGDVLFVADPIRQILVTGKDSKVLDNPTKNFSLDVYWALRHQFEGINTSYATVFANYFKMYDDYSGLYIFVPSSGFVAAKIASTDSDVGPWAAPAGFNRGIVTDAIDVAFAPNQRQRDELYKVNLNPITRFPDQGLVLFGQKTLLKKPSAFDRVNVRRTFLYLEKVTKQVMKFFLFENNTLFTRTRVLNTLTPFFERVKGADGLYDYLIVCDERNNTPEVIDNNELVVDIYLKPVRTAEFILVNFYATRTDTNFQELVGG
jgi:hypothetical protein